ncbi:MAG: hypothetical protein EZS28_029485 [Streblomastix strix]|uniref:Tyr recombinase domain-containing protein n=1 Tax=Streblomastix strix TaxID=222440 RepID=A0A5J4UXD3_9EUKA|nr:MAG: hypothetical protein EZS28_029485 [Streblomastix strix]
MSQELKNEIAYALSRLLRAGDYKLKEKIFQQTCLLMNLNLTIDLFSQHFNNLLPIFMSTIRGHGEIAIDALNHTWKKELPWIHPPIPLLPAVLKKIREEQIETIIVAPLWPGQIWYTELVNENVQFFMLGWSNEILLPGSLLNKMNLKLSPSKIYCFLMDKRPEREENSGQISLRLKKLLDVMGIKGKQAYSFRQSAATQLVVMGLGEKFLNTYTGHARNSKSTNEYLVFVERLKDNEIATKLSDTHGQVECNSISRTQQR